MSEFIPFINLLKNILELKSKFPKIMARIKGDSQVPYTINIPDNRPPAVVVNFSQNATHDAQLAGYCVICEIGVQKKLSKSEITLWAEGAAAIIMKVRAFVKDRPLTIILSCPVAAAFIIGSLLGHSTGFDVLYWDREKYVKLDSPDMDRFRRLL